jgi:hypothetical protein
MREWLPPRSRPRCRSARPHPEPGPASRAGAGIPSRAARRHPAAAPRGVVHFFRILTTTTFGKGLRRGPARLPRSASNRCRASVSSSRATSVALRAAHESTAGDSGENSATSSAERWRSVGSTIVGSGSCRIHTMSTVGKGSGHSEWHMPFTGRQGLDFDVIRPQVDFQRGFRRSRDSSPKPETCRMSI